MRQWQNADATHLSVSTMGARQKTVDHHLAALAAAAQAGRLHDVDPPAGLLGRRHRAGPFDNRTLTHH